MTDAKARRRELHGNCETVGTVCHGCPSLSCRRTRKRTEPWRYYCEARKTSVPPGTVADCERRHRGD